MYDDPVPSVTILPIYVDDPLPIHLVAHTDS